jgi:DNA-binding response OmpR family regulator
MKILIVEDEILQAEVLKNIIQGWGHEVEAVDTGRKAIQALRQCSRDLFLVDVFLADMTAMELIPRIRALQPNAGIVTLTGQSSRGLELRLRELGISYYMTKPFQHDELFSILAHTAARSQSGTTAAASRNP